MPTQLTDSSLRSHSPLQALLAGELDRGIALAADPVNASLGALVLRVTSIQSRWFARTCRGCFDKFREGDQVRLCPVCHEAYHDDPQYALNCWRAHFREGRMCRPTGDARFACGPPCLYVWDGRFPDDTSVAAGSSIRPMPPPLPLLELFLGGLESVWQPFRMRKPIKVAPASGLIGRPCPWCRFRVRSGDSLVACPCGCGTYFHQDIFRRLECWNAWNGARGLDYCPNTGRRFPGEDR